MIICSMVDGQGLLVMPDGPWRGKARCVEWSSYCGPTLMTAEWHESANRQPNEDSEFWALMNEWQAAKFQVDRYGYCLNKLGVRLGVRR